MNNVVLIGRVTRDIELKYTQAGQGVANFNIAVDKGLSKEKKQEFESQNKQTADFINIVVWGKSAEYVANYLKKGKLVAVNGRINTGSYEDKDGKKVYTTDINAFNVEILEWDNDNKKSMDIEGFNEVSNSNIPF